MLTIDQARQQLQQTASQMAQRVESLPLAQALGRIVAEDIQSKIDVPPCDNSAMDGFAINWQQHQQSDLSAEPTIRPQRISQRITAGDDPQPLVEGTAARIFTGASIPSGADSVVMQENCEQQGDHVLIKQAPVIGSNIRRQGQDIGRGQRVLSQGHRLRVQDLGLCAALGITHIQVFQRLRVALLVTGDELVQPGEPLPAGKIYDANSTLLLALLENPCFDIVRHQIVADDFQQTQQALLDSVALADIVLTSGGASVGEEDYVASALKQLGQLDLWKVAIKPGKPIMLGSINSQESTVPVIGLPGNPMSLFVTFLILVKPFLLQGCGRNPDDNDSIGLHRGIAAFSKKAEKRDVFLRAKQTSEGVILHPNQSSGVLSSACWGDVMIHQPAGEAIEQGQTVKLLSYTELNQ